MIKRFLQQEAHIGLLIAGIIAVVYLPFLIHLLQFPKVFPVYGDGQYYVTVADNLLYRSTFSDSLQAPFLPTSFVMPLYPFLLALWKGVFGSYTLFALAQMAMAGFTAFLIYKIGKKLFSERVGLFASLLFMLDPTTIFHSLIIMTDVPYVFLVVSSVYFLFFSDKKNKPTVFFSGLLFGLAMLTRVISMFLPILIVPLYFLVQRKRMATKTIIINLALLALAYSVVVVPWVARNKIVSGVWGIAGEKSLNLFQYYVPEFLSFKRGISADEGRNILMADLKRETGLSEIKDLGSLVLAPFEEKIALGYIKADIFGYAKFHLIKTIPFFLSSQMKNSLIFYNNAVEYKAYDTNSGNMTTLLSHGRLKEFFSELTVSPLVSFEEIFWICISLLAFLGFVFSKDKRYSVFFVAMIFYFAILTGPMAYSRYRLPATPFIFLLASFGASVVLGRCRNFSGRNKVT